MTTGNALVRVRSAVREAAIPAAGLAKALRIRSVVSETMADGEKPLLGNWLSTGVIAAAALLLILWSSGAGGYVQTVVGLFSAYLIAALGYNLVLGYAGQFAFCQNAFMAIGAYTYAVASPQIGALGAFALALVVAPLIGVLVGVAVLRTREIYLALITLAFSQATALAIQLWKPTQGDNGILVQLGGDSTYVIAIVAAAIALLAALRLTRSSFGRAMALTRTDENAAAAMGVSVTRVRVGTFALSALFGGVGGIMLAAVLTFITPTNFTLELTLMLLTMIVVGGVASVWGTVIGVLVIVLVRQGITEIGDVGAYVDAAVLFVILILRPRGLASFVRVRKRGNRA